MTSLEMMEVNRMDNTRRQILKIHGIALIILGVANALISSLGAFWGAGPFGFLQVQRIGHVGLIQAYLLAALFGVVLLLGARQAVPLAWNWVGVAVHLSILVAYVLYWDFFAVVAPGFEIVRFAAIIHISLALLELWAIVAPGARAQRRSWLSQ